MAQETRKDPRAKVLTVTVRYKSATLDEFIEHHSHDVSRGGMFIKTVSPFPPGTLLKIEVRIAGDQRVMQGVGRVVWKRESGEAQDGAPAGMGVKFIKIDDASRGVIDQLVAKSGGAVSAFDKGSSEAGQTPAPAPAAPVAAEAPKPVVRKATMIGLGSLGAAAADAAEEDKPAEKPAAFFPESTGTPSEPPPEDRTVMKQAAELLQDALREAGGSLDEIGTPNVSAAGTPGASSHPPAPVHEPPRPGKSETPPKVEEKPAPAKDKAPEKSATKTESKPQSGTRPGSATRSGPSSSRPSAGTARRVSVPAESIPDGGSGKLVWIVLGVVAVGGGLFVLTRTPSEPAAPPAEPAAATPEPAAAPIPPPPETAAPTPPSEPVPPPVAASALPAETAAPEPPPEPTAETKKPKPVVASPKPAAPKPVAPTPAPEPTTPPAMTAEPKPATPAPTATAAPKPTATAAPAEPKPAAPTPKPPAEPKPKPPASDNPF